MVQLILFLKNLPERLERYSVLLFLTAMALLALVQPVRRWWRLVFHQDGDLSRWDTLAPVLSQYLVLWVAFVGACLAASQSRHIKIDLLEKVLPSRFLPSLNGLILSLSALFCAVMCKGAFQLVFADKSALVEGVPKWWLEVILPVGFGLLTFHFMAALLKNLWQSRSTLLGLLLSGVFLGVLRRILAFSVLEMNSLPLVLFAVPSLFALLLAGMPIFIVLGAAGLIGFLGIEGEASWVVLPMSEKMGRNPYLIAIPLFTFSGYILAQSKAPQRLVELSQSILGWLPGGLAIIALVSCALFTAFTGASGATIIALGGFLFPALLKDGYPSRRALGLVTSSGSLGILFPPSLPLILYGVVTKTFIDQLFLAGILPGCIMLGLLAVYCVAVRRGKKESESLPPVSPIMALRGCLWELPIPLIVIGGIYSGWMTVTEAAAVCLGYVMLVECWIYGDVSFRDMLPKVAVSSMVLVGSILLILASALGFTDFLTLQAVPDLLLEWMQANLQSRILFLLALNVFLLIVGCLMDIFSAIVVVAPLIKPVALALGVNEYHLGIIFLVNLQIGYSTPPVGMNLFIASSRFEKPLLEIYRATLPFLGLLLLVLLLVTYVEGLSLFFLSR